MSEHEQPPETEELLEPPDPNSELGIRNRIIEWLVVRKRMQYQIARRIVEEPVSKEEMLLVESVRQKIVAEQIVKVRKANSKNS